MKARKVSLSYYLTLDLSELWEISDILTAEVCDLLMTEELPEDDCLTMRVKRRQLETINKAIEIQERRKAKRPQRTRQIALPF